jgi:acyl carrier protein
MKIPEGLERRTEAEIREELRGFPPPAIEAVVSLKSGTDPASLRACLLSVLEFYLPQAARRSLADVPDSARLREDLALDSLALAEAAFKLDEVLGIPVETREVGNLSTVGELHAFFCSRLQSDPS